MRPRDEDGLIPVELIRHRDLKLVLHYNPATGIFTWSAHPKYFSRDGKSAGRVNASGYICIDLFYLEYKAHRLAWFYMTGKWPRDTVDHINRDKSDNRWANLREADHSENRCNSSLNVNNTSGYKGVKRHKDKWRAFVGSGSRTVYIGLFESLEEAAEARRRAAEKLHGEFAHHG